MTKKIQHKIENAVKQHVSYTIKLAQYRHAYFYKGMRAKIKNKTVEALILSFHTSIPHLVKVRIDGGYKTWINIAELIPL